jgi:hypothetical protein
MTDIMTYSDFDRALGRLLAHFTTHPKGKSGRFPVDTIKTVYESLRTENWTAHRLKWACETLCKRRTIWPDNLLAALLATDTPEPDAQGNRRGGYYDSPEYRDERDRLAARAQFTMPQDCATPSWWTPEVERIWREAMIALGSSVGSKSGRSYVQFCADYRARMQAAGVPLNYLR